MGVKIQALQPHINLRVKADKESSVDDVEEGREYQYSRKRPLASPPTRSREPITGR